MVTMYCKSTAYISSNESHFLMARVLVKFDLVVNALLSGQKNFQTNKLSGQKNCVDKKIVRTKKNVRTKNCPDKKMSRQILFVYVSNALGFFFFLSGS